ncbi:deaminase (plasmid) [Halostagnicola larsenii XH-48]|uniref:Deaminase n=2 Tax=Halostagnicola larsenii TaxID=353800 RepID=W0JTW0_9EURY|nr:deaminase [Halostagnicola larsenii XH-48]
MSLDGFITAGNQSQEEPLGEGGQQLHAWMEDERGQQILEEASGDLGAVIAGRETYDDSVPWWGSDGPTGPARCPVFVVTHEAPSDVPEDGVYTFITDGIESALEQAKAAAGDQTVSVMGGASIGQQYIAAGLVDEIGIHLVPVLFGSGTRLFENLGDEHIQLEIIDVTESASANHIRFRVSLK